MTPLGKKLGILSYSMFNAILFGQQFMLQNMSWEDGLASANVRDLITDQHGYVWIGGADELTRYDGIYLTRCDQTNNWPIETGSGIYDLELDKNDCLWVLSEDTCLFVCLNKNKKDKKFIFYNDIKNPIKILPNGQKLWCLSEKNIYEIDNYKLISIIALPEQVKSIPKYTGYIYQNRIYIGTEGSGILIYDISKKKYSFIGHQDGLASNTVYSIREVEGKLLFGHENSISILDHGGFKKYRDSLDLKRINHIFSDDYHQIWLVSDKGINVLYNGKVRYNLNKKNNLFSSNFFNYGFADRENNVWLAGNGSGIYQIQNQNFTRYSTFDKKITPVYGIVQDKDDRYWFGYFGKATYNTIKFLDDGHVDRDTMLAIPIEFGKNIYDQINNSIWYEGYNGVSVIKDNKITSYSNISDFGLTRIYDIFYSTYDTAVYAVGFGGVTKFKNGKMIAIPYDYKETEKNQMIVLRGAGTSQGNFLATTYGIKKVVNDKIIDFNLDTKRDAIEGRADLFILAADKYQNIWTDIGNNEILRFRQGEKGKTLSTKYNLFYRFGIKGPYSIYIKNEFFVLSTISEIYIIDLESIYKGIPNIIQKLDQHKGLQPETPYFVTHYIDNHKNLWICGINGAYRYNFLNDKKNQVETINHILGIKVNEKEPNFEKNCKGYDNYDELPISLKLPYNKNEITFEYLGITYKGHEKVFYKTKLIGFHDEWSSPFQDRHITYNNLSPGKYTFQLMSCNNDGVWNKEPYSFSFTILPAWYQTWWFKLLIAFSIAGLIYLIFIWRIGRIRKGKERQEKLTQAILESQEEERKRIAQDLHDGVGQKLSILKVKVEQKQYDPVLEKVIDIIEDIRFLSRNIHPHYFEKLGLTKAIETLVEEIKQLGTIYWVHELEKVDEYFSTQQQLMIFRTVQECMNNIIKHSQAKNAKISFEKSGNCININIQDNGIGFNLDQAKLHSLGLSTIRERVKSLNGTIQIKTKPDLGTQTEIIIPIKNKK